ncbi:hypothetical protein ACNKHS_16920 [Shigella flexneri]
MPAVWSEEKKRRGPVSISSAHLPDYLRRCRTLQDVAKFREGVSKNLTEGKKTDAHWRRLWQDLPLSDGDRSFNAGMRVVALNLKIIKTNLVIYPVLVLRSITSFGNARGSRVSWRCVCSHMVAVKAGFTARPDKIADFEIALLRHHVH